MTRLPKDRSTQLNRGEIVAEALRQFDETGTEPSVRGIAKALRVAPSAIYNHYPSREAIVRAAVRQVWQEALRELLEIVPRPFEAEPDDVLVACGLATRRAWLAHYQLAPYLAASPEVDGFTRDGIGLMSNLMERLGLEPEEAAAAFHSYMSFMIGSVLFAAAREVANQQLSGDGHSAVDRRFRTEHTADSADSAVHARSSTRKAIDGMVDLSVHDPTKDEEQFIHGMRRLVASLIAPE